MVEMVAKEHLVMRLVSFAIDHREEFQLVSHMDQVKVEAVEAVVYEIITIVFYYLTIQSLQIV